MQRLLILDWDIAGRQGEDKGLDQATELEMREYFGDKQILSFENKPMWKGYLCHTVFFLLYSFGYKTEFSPLKNDYSPMKFCCNMSFTLPKQSQRSRWL